LANAGRCSCGTTSGIFCALAGRRRPRRGHGNPPEPADHRSPALPGRRIISMAGGRMTPRSPPSRSRVRPSCWSSS